MMNRNNGYFNLSQDDLKQLAQNIMFSGYPEAMADARNINTIYNLQNRRGQNYLNSDDLNNVYGYNFLDILNRYNQNKDNYYGY